MGLDMYAYSTETTISDADFDTPEDAHEFTRWRNHAHLNRWMAKVYWRKGGTAQFFDGVTVKLDPADIDALENVVLAGGLPLSTGLVFGKSQPDGKTNNKPDDLAFIAAARKHLEDGNFVFYVSRW